MTPSEFIVDVSESNFEYEVLSYSQNLPVVVDFWAEWCQPCKRLGPLLEQLTEEARGNFRLARVDVDANPNLALRYSVRSIPTVKAFSQGQVVLHLPGCSCATGERVPGQPASPKRGTACSSKPSTQPAEPPSGPKRRTLPLSRRHKILTSRRSSAAW